MLSAPSLRGASHLLIAGLFAAVLLGCHKSPAAPEEGEEEHAAPVKWEKPEEAALEEWTELLGTTQLPPNHAARVSAAVEGFVVSVLGERKGKRIQEGEQVKAGQVLIELDDRVLRATRNKLAAGETERKELVKQAATAVETARLDIDRMERLMGTASSLSMPLVSRIELEKAHLALKDAESKHVVAGSREEAARAELKEIDEQLDLYKLRAPINGQLGLVHAVPGQTLAIGTIVADIVNLDEIDVLCFAPASTGPHLKQGLLARIEDVGEVAGEASKIEPGHLSFIADQAQAETGTIAVKARFPNRNHLLRANVFVRLRVQTEKKDKCLALPESALLEDQEEPVVLLVETEKKKVEGKDGKEEEEEEHKVKKYQVKMGLRDRDKHKVEILALIDPKEKKEVPLTKEMEFVVEGGHGLEDDDLVTEKKEEEEEHKEGEAKEGEHKDEKGEGAKGDDHKDEHKDEGAKGGSKEDKHKDAPRDDHKSDAHKTEK